MNVRSLFRAATVEEASSPYNTIHLKVFYPAQMSGSDQEQNLGIVPADSQQSPFNVVIFFNGINCGPELYQWLAVKLAERGLVVVTFSWVAENIPGMVALTPGVDIKMLAPNLYGTGPTASTEPAEQLRNLIAQAIGLFIDAHVRSQKTAIIELNQLLASNHPLIASFERK